MKTPSVNEHDECNDLVDECLELWDRNVELMYTAGSQPRFHRGVPLQKVPQSAMTQLWA